VQYIYIGIKNNNIILMAKGRMKIEGTKNKYIEKGECFDIDLTLFKKQEPLKPKKPRKNSAVPL
jgi:hypothetical protein